jgi:Glutathione peroxidase
MKHIVSAFLITVLLSFSVIQCTGQNKQNKKEMQTIQKPDDNRQTSGQKTLYDFRVKDIDGNDFDLASLKGKKVLVVNVASKCGLTPQYEQLQTLYEKYKDDNFVILGFPANNFMGQEPGTNAEIKEFCSANYGVTFPMMDKISVSGDDQAPLYKWLTQKSENGKIDQEVTWNFQKYLIDENGRLVDVVMPRESPMDEKIVNWITGR